MRSFFRRVNQVRTNVYLLEMSLACRSGGRGPVVCVLRKRSLWRSHLQEGEAGSLAQPQAGTEVLSTTGRHRGLFHQISRRCRGHTATLFWDPQISVADKSFLLPGRTQGTVTAPGTQTQTASVASTPTPSPCGSGGLQGRCLPELQAADTSAGSWSCSRAPWTPRGCSNDCSKITSGHKQ